jgi:hypothetical protein
MGHRKYKFNVWEFKLVDIESLEQLVSWLSISQIPNWSCRSQILFHSGSVKPNVTSETVWHSTTLISSPYRYLLRELIWMTAVPQFSANSLFELRLLNIMREAQCLTLGVRSISCCSSIYLLDSEFSLGIPFTPLLSAPLLTLICSNHGIPATCLCYRVMHSEGLWL